MGKTRRRRVIVNAGDKYGRLTIVEEVGPRILSGKPCRQFLCKCECGTSKVVMLKDIRSGLIKACGCLARVANLSHGMSGTLVHGIWASMIQRCYNPKVKAHATYGARGITVCQRWRDSFATFLDDMGERPSLQHSIDRIDTDGNYCPENCRWATMKQQGRNRRNNRMITHKGETLCLSEWAERAGLSLNALKCRLDVCGYTVEEALTMPIGSKRPR